MKETRFKQTEIALLPEDWNVTTLSRVCKIFGRIGYRGYSTADIVTPENGAISISPTNIINGQMDYTKCTYISWHKYNESPEIKIYNGDILIVKTGSTYGKSALVKSLAQKATINPQIVVLKDINIDNVFLSYVCLTPQFLEQVESVIVGGAIPTLSQKKMGQFIIPQLCIKEQKKIASALTSIDNLLLSLDKLIEKKRLIKQGTMQELLTGKKRLLGFAGEWVEKRLGEIGVLAMCKRVFQEETSEKGDVPFYKIGTFGHQADAYISVDKYEQLKRLYRFPKKGDILISAAGTIGRTVIYDGKPAYFQDSNIIWLNHNEKQIINKFLYYIYKRVKWNTENTTIARLYNDNFNNMTIRFPMSIEEQRAITSALTSMDREIDALEGKKAKYEQIKQGMMQQLLTGKIRLI